MIPRCVCSVAQLPSVSLIHLRRVRAAAFAALLILLIGTAGASLRATAPTIATVHLTPGWTTFGQAIPLGVAVNGLTLTGATAGALTTQTDVKTRWDADNSIRFAVVTVHVTTEDDYTITAGPASGPAFAPTIPEAAVTLTIAGTAYTATLPAVQAADLWLSGPLAYEGRSVIAPVSGATGLPHDFLRVNFDTRIYNDATGRVDVSVENVLDKSTARTTTYDVAITIGGVTRWTKGAVEHYYLTRWRKVFELDGTSLATIAPDMTPFNVSRALPPFLSLVSNNPPDVATGPDFDILKSGALDPNMPAHGGTPSLAPYPDWTARYLVHKDPMQRAFVLANGDLSGSWPIHVREAEGSLTSGVGPERLVSIDQRPEVWLDERAPFDATVLDYIKGEPLPIHEYGSTDPGPGQSALIPDNAHQPSLAYVPYLLTGDRYYAEEMAFWANYGMLRTYNGDGVRSSTGILENNEVRGYGWSLRNIVDAAAYYPGGAVRNYLADKVHNNLVWLDEYANAAIADPANPMHLLWTLYRPEPGYISLWEQTYIAFAIDRANKQGFTGGLVHRDLIADLQLKLFTSDPIWPRESTLGCGVDFGGNPIASCVWSAPYLIAAGSVPDPLLWEGFTFYTTLAQMAANTVGNADLQRDFAGYYGPEARMNLMIGVEQGWAGAQDSYDYLWPFVAVNDSACAVAYGGDGSADRSDLACRAGWALGFYPAATPPNTVPTFTPPADITVAADTGAGAVVAFTAEGSDVEDGTIAAVCVPASGSTFPIGTTTVNCTVTDLASASVNGSFLVHVVDATSPVIEPHGDETAEATSAAGAVVTYTSPATSDTIDGPGAASCVPASGSTFALGDTPVTCDAMDPHGNAATPTTFLVHVVDTTAPVIAAHGDETAEATGPAGAVVAYVAPSTSDAVDGANAADCAPASGAAFAFGDTTVTCTATDAHGNAAAPATFVVHVVDTTAPVIAAHGDETAEATSAAGAVVAYVAPSTSDAVGGASVAECAPASGVVFALGNTTVTCTATDAHGNAAAPATFVVRVVDTTAPVIAAHADVTAEATSAAGAVVAYTAPSASDTVDGTKPADCAPASGSTFPLGNTTVTCTTSDAHGNAAAPATFVVHVVDTTAPVIAPHANVTVTATGPGGAAVPYTNPTASDLVDGSVPVTCAPASGSTFPIGATTVTCNAADAHGNPATPTTFVVTVQETAPPSSLVLVNPGPQQNQEGDVIHLELEFGLGPRPLFTAANLPPGLLINRNQGVIHGRIREDAAAGSPYMVTVTMTVGSEQVSVQFGWTVRGRNHKPQLSRLMPQKSFEGETIGPLAIAATDSDGDPLVFTARGLPPGLTMSPDGVISGTIARDARDDYEVKITVSDGEASDHGEFDWRIMRKPGKDGWDKPGKDKDWWDRR